MSGSDFCNEILGCFTDLMKSIDPTNPSAVVRRRILRTFHRCWGGFALLGHLFLLPESRAGAHPVMSTCDV